MNLLTRPLFAIAGVRVSTVDKLVIDGEVPVRLCNYTDVYNNEVVNPNLELMEATATPSEVRRFRLQVGDTVFTKDSETAEDIGVPAFVDGSAADFVCGYHLAIARPDPARVYPKYLYWWLSSRDAARLWESRASGVTRVGLRQSEITHFPVPTPTSISQQRMIAEFLDRETAQIDAMIEAQQHLVDRLEERRRAMFAHEVQVRVNCGERLKWSLRESDLRAGDLADKLPLLSVSIDWGVRRRDETINQSASDDLTNYKVVRQGGVVVNRMRAFQGALGRAPEDGIVSPDYSVFRCSPSVDSEWLVVLMRSSPFVSEMAHRIRGIGTPDAGQVRTPRINANDLLDIRVEIPDLDTQRAEVDSWRLRAGQMTRLIEASHDSIALMLDRRAALISAAVTGRIDPRTGQEFTPEMVLESV